MFLNQLVNKEIYCKNAFKGVCRGIGISLKTQSVKYLLCASSPAAPTDFSVAVSAVEAVGEDIRLTSLRPIFPKRCIRIFPDMPAYSYDGVYLGKVVNLEIKEFVATKLFTDENGVYPTIAIAACQDALILKAEQAYPLGQRIPAPALSLVTEKKDALVTKPILRTAIRQGDLVKLTLSLPPFNCVL